MASTQMRQLYQRLAGAGFSRTFVRDVVLPSWWDDEVADTPAGFASGAMLISRHLGLPLRALVDEHADLAVRPEASSKLKTKSGTTKEDVQVARTMAIRLALIAAKAVNEPFHGIPRSPLEVRNAILESGHSCVDLNALLEHLWDRGIPTLYLDTLPPKAKKMDGLAAVVDGRPSIVTCSGRRPASWQLFIVAHELGHIALGHVIENQVLLDDRIDRGSEDKDERDANDWAVELICGSRKSFVASGRWPNAEKLASAARSLGREHGIDPGHIVLNYAHSMGPDFYKVANAALKLLGIHDGRAQIRKQLGARLDWSALPSDTAEFVSRMTGDGTDE